MLAVVYNSGHVIYFSKIALTFWLPVHSHVAAGGEGTGESSQEEITSTTSTEYTFARKMAHRPGLTS